MYKLVAVGGKLRGQEFILEEGENVLGRDSECDIPLEVQGISKKHLSVTVNKDAAYVQDLGSSNGTFINGKLVTRATVKGGDKIALPDLILQVVFVKEKKVVVKKKATQAAEEDAEELMMKGGDAPDNLPGKVLWNFRYKFMPIVHGINEEYEWKQLLGIILAVFIVVCVTLTIGPILSDNKKLLEAETAIRGRHYADEIGRINARVLEQKKLDSIDSKFIENEDGVESYVLFDMEGRIFRPAELINEYVSDSFAVQTLNWAKSGQYQKSRNSYIKRLGNGILGIGHVIEYYNPKVGAREPVGVIAIRFAPKSLAVETTKSSVAYIESLATSALVAVVFFGIIFYLTLRPIEEMRIQIEEALRGRRKNVESRYLFSELNPLRSTVNTMIQRIRELQNDTDESDFGELEADETYVATLGEFMRGSSGPTMILNSEKSVANINSECEDLTGIRESSSIGMSLLDVAREKGFAATVIELCDNSANNGGTHQSGEYELSGVEYSVHVSSLMGKDNFAKAYYVTFTRAN